MRLPVLTARLVCALLFAVAAPLRATIGSGLQMQTGNPSGATADANNHKNYLSQRAQFAIDYNDTTHEPNWVAWDLTAADIGSSGREAALRGAFSHWLQIDPTAARAWLDAAALPAEMKAALRVGR